MAGPTGWRIRWVEWKVHLSTKAGWSLAGTGIVDEVSAPAATDLALLIAPTDVPKSEAIATDRHVWKERSEAQTVIAAVARSEAQTAKAAADESASEKAIVQRANLASRATAPDVSAAHERMAGPLAATSEGAEVEERQTMAGRGHATLKTRARDMEMPSADDRRITGSRTSALLRDGNLHCMAF